MFRIRLNGRGGQGSMVAAKILAVAGARENLFVQAFPEFGVERRGAPVSAYVRVSQEKIYERGRVQSPDHVMVLDPVLIEEGDISAGLRPRGWIVVNSGKSPERLRAHFQGFRVAAVDANSIAIEHELGSRFAPFVNSVMLGAFLKAVPFVQLETLLEVIKENVPAKKEANLEAAREAYSHVVLAEEVEKVWAEK